MKYHEKMKYDTVFRYERTFIDYSEEAIPERDPAYRIPDGTLSEDQTIPVVSAEVRLALARRLEEFGMNAAKAAVVASL
jgi:hypothetical protein